MRTQRKQNMDATYSRCLAIQEQCTALGCSRAEALADFASDIRRDEGMDTATKSAALDHCKRFGLLTDSERAAIL